MCNKVTNIKLPLQSKVWKKEEVATYVRNHKEKNPKFILGHPAYYGICDSAQYFTFLRHPVARERSIFNSVASNFLSGRQNDECIKKLMFDDDKLVSFEEWYKRMILRNGMTYHLHQAFTGDDAPSGVIALSIANKTPTVTREHLENAKRMLDICFFVGVTEYAKEDIKRLCKKVGLSPVGKINASKSQFKLTDDIEDLIRSENKLDLELYEWANSKRK